MVIQAADSPNRIRVTLVATAVQELGKIPSVEMVAVMVAEMEIRTQAR
jgi:hypothetical protein